MRDVAKLREDYTQGELNRTDLPENPLELFKIWIEAAIADEIPEPNAMVLATIDAAGHPNARVVLLKGYSQSGFVFYTNYTSQKGAELTRNSRAALVFNWLAHERQVRVRGNVKKLSRPESEAYFQSRPRSSQLGAWVSPQSEIIANRDVLDTRLHALEAEYEDARTIAAPPHWGGYQVGIEEIEFWQGRQSRLHDRFRYLKQHSSWQIDRLAP